MSWESAARKRVMSLVWCSSSILQPLLREIQVVVVRRLTWKIHDSLLLSSVSEYAKRRNKQCVKHNSVLTFALLFPAVNVIPTPAELYSQARNSVNTCAYTSKFKRHADLVIGQEQYLAVECSPEPYRTSEVCQEY